MLEIHNLVEFGWSSLELFILFNDPHTFSVSTVFLERILLDCSGFKFNALSLTILIHGDLVCVIKGLMLFFFSHDNVPLSHKVVSCFQMMQPYLITITFQFQQKYKSIFILTFWNHMIYSFYCCCCCYQMISSSFTTGEKLLITHLVLASKDTLTSVSWVLPFSKLLSVIGYTRYWLCGNTGEGFAGIMF